MSKTSLERRQSGPIKEKAQYAAALGIIGVMLWVAGFPVFLLFFVGILTFFIWKVFSSEGRNETRRIFEFYLTANEILREDDRRWYGFEIQEAIGRGETIMKTMTAAPPLVSFALGALYQKLDDHSSAVKYLSGVIDEATTRESAIVYPTKELREYVKMLRKIERAPAEAPLTSSAIRALERARKNRGQKILEKSRIELERQPDPSLPPGGEEFESIVEVFNGDSHAANRDVQRTGEKPQRTQPMSVAYHETIPENTKRDREKGERKTISEVLHDIYDGNVQ